MRVQGCDAVQVAVLLSEVQAVTNNELGLDVPADVLDLNVSLDDLGLAQQGANLNGSCAERNEVTLQPCEGQAGVNDVFND